MRSVNDIHPVGSAFTNNMRRPFERLIRKLLRYPNHPAVVLMHEYVWFYVSAQGHMRLHLLFRLLASCIMLAVWDSSAT